MPTYQSKNKKRPFPYVALCLIAVAVLVLAVLVYTILDSTGVIGKLGTAAKSDNFRVSDNELSVYEYQVAMQQLTTEYWYYKYGIMQDTYGVTKMYPDEYSYAFAMLSMYKGTGAFSQQAYAYAQQYLVYCEGAKEAGVELDDEDIKSIDDYITGLETTAESGDMSLSSFLKNYMGTGVSKGDVRSAMEKYQLGVKYAEQLDKEYSDAVTEAEMEKYREDNKASFYTTKYNSYVLVDASLEAKAKECKTVDELKALIMNYYLGIDKADAKVDSKFDTLYAEKITDKIKTDDDKATVQSKVAETLKAIYEMDEEATEHFKSTDTDDYLKAAYAIVDGIKKELDTQFGKINEAGSSAYTDLSDETVAKNATDLQKWLFGDGRTAGDATVIKVETTSSSSSSSSSSSTPTKTTTYTWYAVTDTMVIDTEKTKDAYFAQLADDTKENDEGVKLTAKEKAEAMFEALGADKTTEKFDELAVKYGATSSTALRESISEQSAKSTSEKYAEWLYAEGRKEGDITMIVTDDKTPKYFVVYFVEENEETWKVNARAGVAGEKVQEWFEAGVEKYNVTVDTEAPETEAATEAATA